MTPVTIMVPIRMVDHPTHIDKDVGWQEATAVTMSILANLRRAAWCMLFGNAEIRPETR